MDQLIQLAILCEVLGENATEEQEQNLVSWIVENIPKASWSGVLNDLTDYDTAYTELSMRCGEEGL